ncbi:MAG: DUF6580 family putative transport protein [Chthoniobacteraceae bacterium]
MKNISKACLTASLLLVVAVLYRLSLGLYGSHAGFLSNFAPLAAIALCGGIYLPKKLALPLPLAALFISDLVLNAHYHAALVDVQMLSRYAALAMVVAIGFTLRGRVRISTVLPASVGGSLLFYSITNTGSWIDEPGYAKTFAGWLQALTTGLPGYPPTWSFFRNSLASDVVFTLLFVACMAITSRRESSAAPAGLVNSPATR